jgi:negative regulator of sigma E activity
MNQAAGQNLAPELDLDGSIGALADDALDPLEAQRVLDLLLETPSLRARWDEIHWVGDCLRSEETGALTGSQDFMTRFSERLAKEPTVLAPSATQRAPRRWMRYGVPGAAAVAAVSMVVWIAQPTSSLVADGADGPAKVQAIAQGAPAPAQVQVAKAPVQRSVDPALLREYVMAHQEFGATALHGPGAIQAASFDIPATEGANRP